MNLGDLMRLWVRFTTKSCNSDTRHFMLTPPNSTGDRVCHPLRPWRSPTLDERIPEIYRDIIRTDNSAWAGHI